MLSKLGFFQSREVGDAFEVAGFLNGLEKFWGFLEDQVTVAEGDQQRSSFGVRPSQQAAQVNQIHFQRVE
jgi:hypothetical protein